MTLIQLLHEIFIYEKIVTLTLLFFNTKPLARNDFVQLKQKQESKQKGFIQKSFFILPGEQWEKHKPPPKKKQQQNKTKKRYLELSCFIWTRIEKLIQLELN